MRDIIEDILTNVKATLVTIAGELTNSGQSKRTPWTRACLKSLAILGRDNFDCGVCPWPDNMEGEWLYDLIWYKEEPEVPNLWPRRMTDVILTLESEWVSDISEIRKDFQKIIQACSWIKVLICNNLDDDEYKCLIEDINCFKYHRAGERYLFAFYDGQSGKFIFKDYSVTAKKEIAQ